MLWEIIQWVSAVGPGRVSGWGLLWIARSSFIDISMVHIVLDHLDKDLEGKWTGQKAVQKVPGGNQWQLPDKRDRDDSKVLCSSWENFILTNKTMLTGYMEIKDTLCCSDDEMEQFKILRRGWKITSQTCNSGEQTLASSKTDLVEPNGIKPTRQLDSLWYKTAKEINTFRGSSFYFAKMYFSLLYRTVKQCHCLHN